MMVPHIADPQIEAALETILQTCRTVELEKVLPVAAVLELDPEEPYNDGTPLDQEDLAFMIHSRLLDVLGYLGLATFEYVEADPR